MHHRTAKAMGNILLFIGFVLVCLIIPLIDLSDSLGTEGSKGYGFFEGGLLGLASLLLGFCGFWLRSKSKAMRQAKRRHAPDPDQADQVEN